MLQNIFSMFTSSIPTKTVSVAEVTPKKSNNPFAAGENNVFLTGPNFGAGESYGKNTPVSGGFFAGYYNEQPNIVGRKLFIEV